MRCRALRIAHSWMAMTSLLVLAACDRPPVTARVNSPPSGERPPPGTLGGGLLDLDDDGAPDHMGPVRVADMRKDTAALGSAWYNYDSSSHALTPRPMLTVVRDLDDESGRAAAFRIESYYDAATGESGVFTLMVATFDVEVPLAWSNGRRFVASRNIKATGPICLDLFSLGEVSCDDDTWQVCMRIEQYMSAGSQIVVNNPGLFARSHAGTPSAGQVRFARVSMTTRFDELPPPSSIVALDDTPHETRWDTTVDGTLLSPSVPERGLLIGRRFVDDGFAERSEDAWFIVNGRQTLARFRISPKTEGVLDDGFVVRFAAAPLVTRENTEQMVVSLDALVPHDVDVPLPNPGKPAYLSFQNIDLTPAPPLLESDTIDTAVWPHRPPNGRAYDLAIERGADDVVRVWLSPAAVALEMAKVYRDLGYEPAPLEEMVPPHDVSSTE
jgi:hypothetical protein